MVKNITIKTKMYTLIIGVILSFGIIISFIYNSNYITTKNITDLEKKELKISTNIKEIKKRVFNIKDKTYDFISTNTYNIEKTNKFIKKVNENKSDIDKLIIKEFSNDINDNIENKNLKKDIIKIQKTRLKALLNSAIELAYTYTDKKSTNEDKKFDFQTFQANATLVTKELNELNEKVTQRLIKKIISVKKAINYTAESSLTLTIALVILLIIFTYYISFSILKPLNIMSEGLFDFFKFLNKEVEDVKMIDLKSKDEFGKMSDEINNAIIHIKEAIDKDEKMIQDAVKVMEKMKEGKYNNLVTEEPSNNNLKRLKDELNDVLNSLQENIGNDLTIIKNVMNSFSELDFTLNIPQPIGILEKTTNKLGKDISGMLNDSLTTGMELSEKAKTLQLAFDDLTASSHKQAVSLEETAASIEEITGNIRSNTEKAEKMTILANEAKQTATSGNNLIQKNTSSMEKIDESTKKIDEAISQIEQIAFQTNILSLNAAVEAATAGENGKGFAVVANEVRNLASKSAEVAQDIKKLVEEATERTKDGREISDSIKTAFGDLINQITETAELVEEVTEANREQLEGMLAISESSSDLEKITQENVEIVSQTANTTQELNIMAENIAKEVKKKKFIEDNHSF